jgi:hypothetical protein
MTAPRITQISDLYHCDAFLFYSLFYSLDLFLFAGHSCCWSREQTHMCDGKSTELGFREGTSSSKLDQKAAPAASFMVKRMNQSASVDNNKEVSLHRKILMVALRINQPPFLSGRAALGWLTQNEGMKQSMNE